MDYATYGDTTDRIAELVSLLNELKSCLTTDLLETSEGSFDDLNSKIDDAIAAIEEVKGNISGDGFSMQTSEDYFNGGGIGVSI